MNFIAKTTLSLCIGLSAASAQAAPAYIQFYDWFDSKTWDEPDPFQYELLGTSFADQKTEPFYEAQFKYISALKFDALAWQYNLTGAGTFSAPPEAAVKAAATTGIKLAPTYDLEITMQVRRQQQPIAAISADAYVHPTQEVASMICDDLGAFRSAVPTEMLGVDDDGYTPIFVFGFGLDREATDPAQWESFAAAVDACMSASYASKYRFYWASTNVPFQEYLFAHHGDHFRPWHFVLDMPLSQFNRTSVTVNMAFDNHAAATRDNLPRAIRVDPRYLQETIWLAGNADPTLLYFYGWDEPFEDAHIFPSKAWGETRANLARWVIEQAGQVKDPLASTALIVDDVWTAHETPWHHHLLRDMLLYRFRLFAPQASLVLASEIEKQDLSTFDMVIDATSKKPAALITALKALQQSETRVLLLAPLTNSDEWPMSDFIPNGERKDLNTDVALRDTNANLFVRDDTLAGDPCDQCRVSLYADFPDGETAPVVVQRGHWTLVNSYSNNDAVMTAAFEALYGRPMGKSILYGEAYASQRLERAVDGTFTQNTLSRGSVNLQTPLPAWYNPYVMPPEVPETYRRFIFGLN